MPGTRPSASSTTSGLAEAHAAVEAAAEAGIELVLLLAAYGRGGLERFRQESPPTTWPSSSPCARPACASASPPTPSAPAPATGSRSSAPTLRASVFRCTYTPDEQPREIEECIAEHGLRPIELLAETGCLGPHATVVHATHANGRELDLVAQAGARICVCPTTEANLGDGFVPAEEICERGIGICIGSDSNVRIDPLEELRELEGVARRRTLAGGTSSRSPPSSAAEPTRARRRSAWSVGPTSRSTSSIRR